MVEYLEGKISSKTQTYILPQSRHSLTGIWKERFSLIMKVNSIKKHLNLKDLKDFAKELKPLLKKPQVLLLEGPLGVGKTTFVRLLFDFLAEGDQGIGKEENGKKLQKGEPVVSPAFSVHHSYSISFGLIQHIDLYRLKNDEDLESTGFWDVFSEPKKKNLIIIEWADLLNPHSLPPFWNYIKLKFSFGEYKETRHIQLEFWSDGKK
jgi:tRNA threonylcarbamoyladenosine biosynthesis protein TsaE